MTNTELPSIQHLLSSLEEPSHAHNYVLPALVLPKTKQSLSPISASPQLLPPPQLPPITTSSAERSGSTTHCTCKSHRRNSTSHIPRPRNAFILFRQHFHYELFPKNGSMLNTLGSFRTNSEISREIGQRWRGLSPKEKQYWHNLALEEKEKHRLMYPDYKYVPRKMEVGSSQCNHCMKKRRRS